MESIEEEIKRLCEEKDACILAHYYVDESIQKIAHYVGDSFYLAKVAKNDERKTLVFCGVTFMGESAKIINPAKKVLIPAPDAVCPMALMADVKEIEKMRREYDDLAVVCYINSEAKTKALSDVCVTSSNALKVVKKLPNKNIYFIPDNNLGRFVAKMLPEKNVILNRGFCHVHTSITADDIARAKWEHKDALIIAHPECTEEVSDLADFLGSTKELIEFSAKNPAKEFIVCTEKGVLFEMQKKSPEKKFYFVGAKQICPNMKKLTLQKVRDCLANGFPEVEVSDDLRIAAAKPLEKMLLLAAD